MGFFYSEKGKSGDLLPRAECAETWVASILDKLPKRKVTLLCSNLVFKVPEERNPDRDYKKLENLPARVFYFAATVITQ